MRLIDAEDIPYTMLYKENWMKGTGEEAQGAWKSDIDKMPTIDAVPVIRCRDCKYYWKNNSKYKSNMEDLDDLMMCLASPSDDAFCSEGERKDNEQV